MKGQRFRGLGSDLLWPGLPSLSLLLCMTCSLDVHIEIATLLSGCLLAMNHMHDCQEISHKNSQCLESPECEATPREVRLKIFFARQRFLQLIQLRVVISYECLKFVPGLRFQAVFGIPKVCTSISYIALGRLASGCGCPCGTGRLARWFAVKGNPSVGKFWCSNINC